MFRKVLSLSLSAVCVASMALAAAVNPPGLSKGGLSRFESTTFQGLGDSITGGQPSYCDAAFDISNVPLWTTGASVVPGRLVKNSTNDLFYTNGTGTTGATMPTVASPNDGTILWVYNKPSAYKTATSYLTWAEVFSGGRLNWDMAQGYNGTCGGVFDVVLSSGGSNYSPNPTITLDNGGTATATVVNGVITKINILSPGFSAGPVGVTITDGTGSGATVASVKTSPSGTFGITGEATSNILARVNDAASSSAQIIVVHAGVNDAKSIGITADTTIANLRTIFDTLQAAGKRVIVIPVNAFTPSYTTAYGAKLLRINRFIEAYCRGETWANPSGYRAIRMADARPYLTDQSSAAVLKQIGGSGGVAGSMVTDGIHPSQLGGAYLGYVVAQAAQPWVGPPQDYINPYSTGFDGFDPTYNPSGNMFTGLPWQASTAYALGAQVIKSTSTGVKYTVTTAGISAASGGPVGNGASIADGSVVWEQSGVDGRHNFSSGTGGTLTAAAGVTHTGSVALGWAVTRTTGTAVGSVTESLVSYANGRPGTQQQIIFSLGSGGTNEVWRLVPTASANHFWGITAADLGVSKYYMEVELELSGLANFNGAMAYLLGYRFEATAGGSLQGVGQHYLGSSGEQIAWPNGGRMLLRTQPMTLPATNTTLQPEVVFTFDASGGAGSSTATVKINSIAVRRAMPRRRRPDRQLPRHRGAGLRATAAKPNRIALRRVA